MPRMRKKRNLENRMACCAGVLIQAPAALRGQWKSSLFPGAAELRVELGCGKGRFTVETAARNPQVLYIAIERVADALVMAMERAMELRLSNLYFICQDAAELSAFFAPEEVDWLYINFCDPWPAKRHARRRLIHRDFLLSYRRVLAPGGELHFKTDNLPLFRYSLTQFPLAGYAVEQLSYDLHSHVPDAIMTDFEVVFRAQGVQINYCVGKLLPTLPKAPEQEPLQSLLDYWELGEPVPRGMDLQALLQRVKEKQEKQQS